jgi:hypothetical protein
MNTRIFVAKAVLPVLWCCAMLSAVLLIGVNLHILLLIRDKFRGVRRPPTLLLLRLPVGGVRGLAIGVSLGFPMLRSRSVTARRN